MMEGKRFLGIDPGGRRLGVAISDPLGTIAQSLETVLVNGPDDACRKILRLAEEHGVDGIVVGLPLHLSGDDSMLTREARRLAAALEAAGTYPVYLEDERFSSRVAESVLHLHGRKIKGNKEKIDRIAAAVILQSFLDRRRTRLNDEKHEPE